MNNNNKSPKNINKNKLSSSFLTTTPEKGKKTALKLLNKYAESFNSLKAENTMLKQQIKDLNLNLKINKSIIENFFSEKKIGDKLDFFVSNIFKENQVLLQQKEFLEKKNMELNSTINLNEQNYIETMVRIKEENESLKTKIFLLEQSEQKKNFIIEQQNNKINLSKNKHNKKIKNEIFVTNPSKIVNNINNELIVYKNMYMELSNVLKDNRYHLEKYQKKIIELQNENNSLRNEYKTYIFNSNKERENLMQTIQYERKKNNKSRNYLFNKNNINNGTYNSKTSENIDIIKQKEKENLEKFNENYFINEINRKKFEHEDFLEILKNAGLTLYRFEKIINFKNYDKFKEIIESLLNLVKDKEKIISILQKENESLNQNNYLLNEENFKLKNSNSNGYNKNIKIKNTINLFKEYLDNNNNKNVNNNDKDNDTIIHNNKENNKKDISTAVKIPDEIIKKKTNKKFIGTLASITSSEYKEEYPNIESFLSTIKFDELNGTQKTNGQKENIKININYKNNK
jgi:N-terminal acetyltransferase B complex non-catalytic subunit